jgi:hypothetical protein
MATYPDNLRPSTPESTAAVAQSRLGVPTVAATEPSSEYPGLDSAFCLGPGVERAVQARPYERQSGDPVSPVTHLHPGPGGVTFRGRRGDGQCPLRAADTRAVGSVIQVMLPPWSGCNGRCST